MLWHLFNIIVRLKYCKYNRSQITLQFLKIIVLPGVPVALTPIISPYAYNNSDIVAGAGL